MKEEMDRTEREEDELREEESNDQAITFLLKLEKLIISRVHTTTAIYTENKLPLTNNLCQLTNASSLTNHVKVRAHIL